MARISLRKTAHLKLFSLLHRTGASAFLLFALIQHVTGIESLAPEGTKTHWVSQF